MGVRIDVEYLGGFKTRAVHGPSGTALLTAAPKDNHGDGSSFSPTDLAATAFATCLVTVFAIAAGKHGLDVAGTTVEIEKEMSAALPRRIERLPVVVTVPPGVPAERRAALEAAARACPVALSLRPGLESEVRFVWRES